MTGGVRGGQGLDQESLHSSPANAPVRVRSSKGRWPESSSPHRYPVRIFLLLSGLFGILIFLTPPMRGPDEPAHFIRAYGISQGQVIPLGCGTVN
jgi:hypothetical protein